MSGRDEWLPPERVQKPAYSPAGCTVGTGLPACPPAERAGESALRRGPLATSLTGQIASQPRGRAAIFVR